LNRRGFLRVESAARKAKIMIGCQEVSRIVSPFALEEAVGGRQ